MDSKILLYEELSLNAHPALQTQVYDGWVLRFANGYTNRANSINPLYPSTLDLQIKIAECEKRYFAQGLQAVYKLTDGSNPNIDKTLEQHGYSIVTPTYIMEMDLQGKNFLSGDCIMADHADDEWLNAYFSFGRYTESVKMATAKQILDNVKSNMICGRLVKNGTSVACGSAVIERGYMALLNIVVDEPQRGKGYGTEICESLISASQRFGARTAYMQVVQNNEKAVNLYTKLGYKTIYSYWYRVKKGES
ncbi:MAG: GNAT family N-acetyltransferase [Oscillospiraceae bacterium]|nr:GNAT family N-acetyltransferase [Oscillospiraceae bacterium]